MDALVIALGTAAGAGLGALVGAPKRRAASAGVGAALSFACIYMVQLANDSMLDAMPSGSVVPSATSGALPQGGEVLGPVPSPIVSEPVAQTPTPGMPTNMRGRINAPTRPSVTTGVAT